jgi:hypothetical protein
VSDPTAQVGEAHPLLIFLHLPKTAGSTLDGILERQYGSNGVLALFDSFFGEELTTVPRSVLESTRVITGHLYFGVHDYVSRPSSYFTILRDPVDRVISHYHYVLCDPSHYLHPLAKESSLEEYVISCNRAEPNNDQTRLLAGRDLLPGDGTWKPEMLPVAIENLNRFFSFVGLTEDFDQSLILMKRIFGWRTPFYIRQNVSRQRPAKESFSPETQEIIRSYNGLDVQLHAYARKKLQDAVRGAGDSFERDVRIFQMSNQLYGILYRLAARKSPIKRALLIDQTVAKSS